MMGKLQIVFVAAFFIFALQHARAQEPIEPCKDWEIECKNSYQCIPIEFVCDDWIDCDNGWDEGYPTCPCEGFICPSSDTCIPKNYVCDDYNDCPNGEDESEERNCPPCFPCLADKDLCIPGTWVCDGSRDCKDGADEENCEKPKEIHSQPRIAVNKTKGRPTINLQPHKRVRSARV